MCQFTIDITAYGIKVKTQALVPLPLTTQVVSKGGDYDNFRQVDLQLLSVMLILKKSCFKIVTSFRLFIVVLFLYEMFESNFGLESPLLDL